jgi:hypothetical protein
LNLPTFVVSAVSIAITFFMSSAMSLCVRRKVVPSGEVPDDVRAAARGRSGRGRAGRGSAWRGRAGRDRVLLPCSCADDVDEVLRHEAVCRELEVFVLSFSAEVPNMSLASSL